MRDRLIELFKKMDKNPEITCPKPDDVEACETCKYKITELLCDGLARKVDYLLANGVLALPVKIGQTIYRMNIYNDAYREATVVAIYYAEDKKYHPKPHILVHHGDERGRLRINFSDLGKTVFLTREEAEKALAERSTDEK